MHANTHQVTPPHSFYQLTMLDNRGTEISFEKFRGKKVLLVNTASECGYTPQYNELQELYQLKGEHIEIIGFPANDFGEQEQGNDEEIANFCKLNYGVTFPLAQKSSVIKNDQQNKVFEWLTHKEHNGWNDQPPTWNFSKYLVNEKGILTNFFEPSYSPLGEEIKAAIAL